MLVFKGDPAGRLLRLDQVFNAQQAGAPAVILISLFGGAPSALATNGEPITIPAVMITANDGYAILDELSPARRRLQPGTVNATLNDAPTMIPAYTDAMTDFTPRARRASPTT